MVELQENYGRYKIFATCQNPSRIQDGGREILHGNEARLYNYVYYASEEQLKTYLALKMPLRNKQNS